jgi:hypothetical protein
MYTYIHKKERLQMGTLPNYTPEMVATLKEAQPIDYAKAITLGKLLGKSPRSIIAKVKREGLQYIVKLSTLEVKTRMPRVTKADYVEAIAKALSMDADELNGLELARIRSLSNLLMNIS